MLRSGDSAAAARSARPAHLPLTSASLAVACALLTVSSAPCVASPLYEVATHLACGDRANVEEALRRLEGAPHARFGVPDESLTGEDPALSSGSYDHLLDALANARQRFPELAAQIDGLVVGWDFCALTAEEQRWDLALGEGAPWRIQPATMAPLLGRGFAAWGLLPRRANGRPHFIAEAAAGSATSSPPQCQSTTQVLSTPHGSVPALPAPADRRDLTLSLIHISEPTRPY